MLSVIIILSAAIFFPGIILRTKSIVSGRKGPAILQPMLDIQRLFKKGSVFAHSSSIITQIAPTIYFATIVTSLLVLPLGQLFSVISFEGDFIFFIYLLGLGKFFMIIGALDIGSSFQGMGANREALYSMLVEPAFLILLGTFAMLSGYTSFSEIYANFHFSGYHSFLIGLLAFYLLIQFAMIENSRMPIDDPKTHLELTMIHEVMVLDVSGFDLALIQLGSAIKFAIFGTLISNSIIPARWNLVSQIALFFGFQLVYAVIVGLLESFRARNKMHKNSQFILTLSLVALIAFVLVLIFTNKLINA